MDGQQDGRSRISPSSVRSDIFPDADWTEGGNVRRSGTFHSRRNADEAGRREDGARPTGGSAGRWNVSWLRMPGRSMMQRAVYWCGDKGARMQPAITARLGASPRWQLDVPMAMAHAQRILTPLLGPVVLCRDACGCIISITCWPS